MKLDDIYILNPYYTLRKDIKRIILCKCPSVKVPLEIAEDDIIVFIHPVFAVAFSLFNGKDNLEKVLQKMSVILTSTIKDCYDFILPFLENPKRIGIEYDEVFFEFPKLILLNNNDNKFNYKELNYKDYFIESELDFKTQRLFEGPTTLRLLVNNADKNDLYLDGKVNDSCKIPIKRIKEIISEAKKMNVVDFDIAGTEIFTYKHWFELVRELVINGYYPNLTTKLPITEEIIFKLKRIGINDLELTIDAFNEEESEVTNQNPKQNYVNNMFKTLKLLEKHKVNVVINTVITKYNSSLNGIKKVLDKISEYENVEAVKLNPADSLLSLDALELNTLSNYIFSLKSHYKFKISFPDYLPKTDVDTDFETKYDSHESVSMCTANVSQICILNDGQVTICEEFYWNENFLIGNAIQNSIKEIWQSDKAIKLNQMLCNSI